MNNLTRQHQEYFIHQHRLAYVTIKVFDVVYGTKKADYSVTESLDNEVQECTQHEPGDDIMLITEHKVPMQHIRKLHIAIYHHLLRLLIHRPWAARGFRDAALYYSAVQSVSAARWVLRCIVLIDWDMNADARIYEAHLAGILVRAALHALSMLLLKIHLESPQSNRAGGLPERKADAQLFLSALGRCERLANSMPILAKHFFRLISIAGRALRHCFERTSGNGTSVDQDLLTYQNRASQTQSGSEESLHDIELSSESFNIDWQHLDDIDWQQLGNVDAESYTLATGAAHGESPF